MSFRASVSAGSILVALLVCLALSAQDAARPAAADATLHVGLRRSSYGLRDRNGDHAWWSRRAREFAANFPGAKPAIIEIVSTYQPGDGSTELEFARPADFRGPAAAMTFAPGALDHEKALAEYDAAGVQAVLQVEPGAADVGACLEAAWRAFGKHPCVIGFGVDAEWFCTKGSARDAGRPVTDAEARSWMQKALSLNPRAILFLKHWGPRHMPPTYRHPQLVFLSDSQNFDSRPEWMADLRSWARSFRGSTLGFQFGYPKDRPWWSRLARPPVELGQAIRGEFPAARWLFWVDFTAGEVEFK